MARRRNGEEAEIPFVALMDTMSNVVGVLLIVMVMIGMSLAEAVKKVFTDLPPIDTATYEALQKEVKLQVPTETPEKVEQDIAALQQKLKKAIEELKNQDTTAERLNVKNIDIEALKKQIADKTQLRDTQKEGLEKLIAELELLIASLDQTPVFVPPPASVIKMPNPRPYPKDAEEVRFIVAPKGIIQYTRERFMKPVLDGLEKSKSQFFFSNVNFDTYQKLLSEAHEGDMQEARRAAPVVFRFIDSAQLSDVAQAYHLLHKAGFTPDQKYLEAIGRVAKVLSTSSSIVSAAMAELSAGEPRRWLELDRGAANGNTWFTVAKLGPGYRLSWVLGTSGPVVHDAPKPLDVFPFILKVSDLPYTQARIDQIAKPAKGDPPPDKIFDADKLQSVLESAGKNPTFANGFAIKVQRSETLKSATNTKPAPNSPSYPHFVLELTPTSAVAESTDRLKQPASNFRRALLDMKKNPRAVAVFRLMPNCADTYLAARDIADELGIPATWNFFEGESPVIKEAVIGYPIQSEIVTAVPKLVDKTKEPPKPLVADDGPVITIKPAEKTLD